MTEPKLAAPVRTINWGGRQLRRMGVPLVRLDESSLLSAASKKAGLSDFGDERFREGFGRLLQSFENEGDLSVIGRVIARSNLLELLVNRLEMVEVHKQYPEIAEEKIRRPIFIIGMPRTGTSILHELLAQDPSLRTPLSWEVARSCPPPERDTYDTDPRIAEIEAHFARTDRLIPDFKKMHPLGALLPQECVMMMAHDFASVLFQTFFHVPSYATWLQDEADMGSAYAAHRRHLQLLQWRCPAEQWILKSPGHLWSLDALVEEYPDACFIQTHRDPIKIISSLTSLVTMLWTMSKERVDRQAVAREWAPYIAMSLERSVKARENGIINSGQVIDIHFGNFMADTFGTIQRIYDYFGIEFNAEAETRMRQFLAENPGDKHGKHTYRFSETGLDLDGERNRVRHYQEYFGVQSEGIS